jgi:hypothetical protein
MVLIPLKDYNKIPPVVFYILKHIHSLKLNRKIIKKVFNKKDKLIKAKINAQKQLFD